MKTIIMRISYFNAVCISYNYYIHVHIVLARKDLVSIFHNCYKFYRSTFSTLDNKIQVC